ncbi:PaaI family thioesterase [Mycobacterium sp. MBM]|nr:PaaI family thioesterase [Mycobacterium sp. MBM]
MHEPRDINAELTQHITDSFNRQGLMRHLGATITALRAGYCEIRAPYRPELTQQHGYFHAGVTSALVDTAGGYAGMSTYTPNDSVLTVDFTVNLLAPAIGEVLTARASVIKSGRTLTVCELQAYTERDGEQIHIATGRQTLIRLLDTADVAR